MLIMFFAAADTVNLNLDVKMFVVRQTESENRFKCVDEVGDIL